MDTADAARLTEAVTGAVADAVKRGESYSSLENFLTDESVERMTEAVIEETAKTQTGRRSPKPLEIRTKAGILETKRKPFPRGDRCRRTRPIWRATASEAPDSWTIWCRSIGLLM